MTPRRKYAYWGVFSAVAVIATIAVCMVTIGGFLVPAGAPAAESRSNLVTNPSFESDTAGWGSWQSETSRIKRTDAPNGVSVARVERTKGTAFSLDDVAPTVGKTVGGGVYTASAFVAAGSPSSVGKSVILVTRERESDGGLVQKTTSAAAVLTDDFQRIEVKSTSAGSGNTIELYAIQERDSADGDAFLIDAVSLFRDRVTAVPEATPSSPTVTPTNVPPVAPPAAEAVAPPTGPMPAGPAGPWNLRFSDEFDVTALDTSKWNTGWFGEGITPGVNEVEAGCYNSENVAVASGNLRLTVREKQERCDGVSQPYSTAMVNTHDKYSYTHGYAETRMYIPATADGSMANWPVFWTNGENWPDDGENDIVEGLRGGMDYRYHYTGTDGAYQNQGITVAGTWVGWHTFGSEWTDGATSYYFDGQLVGQVTAGTNSPHYLVMAYTMGDWVEPALLPATLQVDYVRVWQR